MSAVQQAPVTCPACGTPAWTRLCRRSYSDTTPDGDALWCDICRFLLWEGVIASPGRSLEPEAVEAAVGAAMRRFGRAIPAGYRLFVEPWDRTIRLVVVDTAHPWREGALPADASDRAVR